MSEQADKKAVFIHQVLPGLFFKNPSPFINAFDSNGIEYGNYLWKNLSKYSADFENQGILEFQSSTHQIDKCKITLIEFTEATKINDCFAIAFVYRNLSDLEIGIERVFTIEVVADMEKSIGLFEWDQAIHRNIKSVNKYSAESFINEIINIINPAL